MFWNDPIQYGATLPYKDITAPVPFPVQTPFANPYLTPWQHFPRFLTPPVGVPQTLPHIPQAYPQFPQAYSQFPQGNPQFPQAYSQFPQGHPQFPQGHPQFPQAPFYSQVPMTATAPSPFMTPFNYNLPLPYLYRGIC